MPTSGTTALSAEVQALYDGEFLMQGQSMVYHDQFCDLRMQMDGQRGRTYNFPILESGQPNYTPLDELEDVSAQQMRANEIVVTLYEYGGAIEITKLVAATSYVDVAKQAAYVNGYNVAESVDFVARATFGQGSRVFRQNSRASRSVFAGKSTAADRLTPAFIERLTLFTRTLKMPLYDDGCVSTVLHPFPFYDLLQASDVRNLAINNAYSEILFNGEIAYWSGLRIIVSANAKAFWGSGANDATNVLATTLATAGSVADTNLKVASVTTVVAGMWIAINDGVESGNTWYDTNELFQVTTVGTAGAGGTGLDGFVLDPGPGDGGGLRYAHASGTTVTTKNSTYPMVVFGPNSVTKVASDFTGPYGETIVSGPHDRLLRFLTFAWYLIAGYQRTRNGWLFRGEVGSSES